MEIYSTKISNELIDECKNIGFTLFNKNVLHTMLEEDKTCFIVKEKENIVALFEFYPIENGELILLYDFPYNEYELDDDDICEFNYIGAIEINPLYKKQGYGKKITQWIKENNPNNKNILIKSVNNSVDFWEKQDFHTIVKTYYNEIEYWMLFSE